MKSFKKLLRLSGLVLLIALACFGIGIIGGTPVPPRNKREDTIEIVVELVEPADTEDMELVLFDKT
ncbi:hypothetical protein GZH53_19350 [Flavihumibacter sp. R14]|nr:hypothetical protein [Flavihumibacter soli]